MWSNLNFHTLPVGTKICTISWKTLCQYRLKPNIPQRPGHDNSIPVYTRPIEMHTYFHIKIMYKILAIGALIIIAPNRKLSNYPLIIEWINKMIYLSIKILSNRENKWTSTTFNSMDKCHKHNVEGSQEHTKKYNSMILFIKSSKTGLINLCCWKSGSLPPLGQG